MLDFHPWGDWNRKNKGKDEMFAVLTCFVFEEKNRFKLLSSFSIFESFPCLERLWHNCCLQMESPFITQALRHTPIRPDAESLEWLPVLFTDWWHRQPEGGIKIDRRRGGGNRRGILGWGGGKRIHNIQIKVVGREIHDFCWKEEVDGGKRQSYTDN